MLALIEIRQIQVQNFIFVYVDFFRQGHLEMIVFLMKHGADPSSLDIEGTVRCSTNPLKFILF